MEPGTALLTPPVCPRSQLDERTPVELHLIFSCSSSSDIPLHPVPSPGVSKMKNIVARCQTRRFQQPCPSCCRAESWGMCSAWTWIRWSGRCRCAWVGNPTGGCAALGTRWRACAHLAAARPQRLASCRSSALTCCCWVRPISSPSLRGSAKGLASHGRSVQFQWQHAHAIWYFAGCAHWRAAAVLT